MKTKLFAVAMLITLAGCTGGGETVVSGFGNSGNFFGVDAVNQMLEKTGTDFRLPRAPEPEGGGIRSVAPARGC